MLQQGMSLRYLLNTNNYAEKTAPEERKWRYDPHHTQKRKPGLGFFPGAGCPGYTWVLGLLYRAGNARQDRTRHWRSGGGCGGVGHIRSAAINVAAARIPVLDPASDLLRLSRYSPLRRWSARPERGIRAGLCDQPCPNLCVGAVIRVCEPGSGNLHFIQLKQSRIVRLGRRGGQMHVLRHPPTCCFYRLSLLPCYFIL